MKSKQIRIPVDVLDKLEKKLIAEGEPAALVRGDLTHYVTAALWGYVAGKFTRQDSIAEALQTHTLEEIVADERQGETSGKAKPREVFDPVDPEVGKESSKPIRQPSQKKRKQA